MVKLVSKLTKTYADNGLLSKIQKYLGNDDEVVGEVILKAINGGKSQVIDYTEGDVFELQKISFTVGKLPMEISKWKAIMPRYGKFNYELDVDILGDKKLKISNSLLEKIFNKLYNQYKGLSESKTEIKERCWKGYTQKGMKTMFGKRYPNCVKKTK